jgi:hypothetical protein
LVTQLAEPGLNELPAPVEANGERRRVVPGVS